MNGTWSSSSASSISGEPIRPRDTFRSQPARLLRPLLGILQHAHQWRPSRPGEWAQRFHGFPADADRRQRFRPHGVDGAAAARPRQGPHGDLADLPDREEGCQRLDGAIVLQVAGAYAAVIRKRSCACARYGRTGASIARGSPGLSKRLHARHLVTVRGSTCGLRPDCWRSPVVRAPGLPSAESRSSSLSVKQHGLDERGGHSRCRRRSLARAHQFVNRERGGADRHVRVLQERRESRCYLHRSGHA